MKKEATTFSFKFDYIFNVCGLMIGFSNVWRFPYVCYKNGGGAFLIAYWVFAIFLIFPLVIMESAIGQYSGKSVAKVWEIIPLMSGIGFAAPIIMFFSNMYHAVVLSWTLRWIVATFSSNVSWANCQNEWNTNSCIPLLHNENISQKMVNLSQFSHKNISQANGEIYQSSVEEFWNNHILAITEGIENLGGIKVDILLCHAAIWTGVYFSIWKGIKWTSKIVYVTATLPIIMLLVVLVRGATLEGAKNGIEKFIRPNITKLGEVELWTDAADQVLYSTGVCAGGIATLGKFNKFKHNFFRDSILLIVLNGLSSFLVGFATFSVLGFLAYSKNTTVDEVTDSGPGLVFIAYPTALTLLPLPQFWCGLFFIMLLLLGFDSEFVYHETFIACTKDLFPRLYKHKYASEFWIGIASVILFTLALPILTRGGMFVLEIFNTYSVTGWCLYFMSLAQFITVGWLYGTDKFCDNMETMLGFQVTRVPRILLKICWKFVGPAFSTVLMINSFVSYEPLKLGKSYVYPVWADILGWATALTSTLLIPITAIYILYTAKGQSFLEKLRVSVRPRDISRIPDREAGELECRTTDGKGETKYCKESLL